MKKENLVHPIQHMLGPPYAMTIRLLVKDVAIDLGTESPVQSMLSR